MGFKKMNKSFNSLDYIRTFIDDLLIVSNKSFEDQRKQLDKGLNELNSAGFNANAEKYFFARNELE